MTSKRPAPADTAATEARDPLAVHNAAARKTAFDAAREADRKALAQEKERLRAELHEVNAASIEQQAALDAQETAIAFQFGAEIAAAAHAVIDPLVSMYRTDARGAAEKLVDALRSPNEESLAVLGAEFSMARHLTAAFARDRIASHGSEALGRLYANAGAMSGGLFGAGPMPAAGAVVAQVRNSNIPGIIRTMLVLEEAIVACAASGPVSDDLDACRARCELYAAYATDQQYGVKLEEFDRHYAAIHKAATIARLDSEMQAIRDYRSGRYDGARHDAAWEDMARRASAFGPLRRGTAVPVPSGLEETYLP